MIFFGIISLIIVQIKTPKMTKVFHNIYWNLLNLTGDAAGESYAFVYAKPPYLVMKGYAPYLSRNAKADFDFHTIY